MTPHPTSDDEAALQTLWQQSLVGDAPGAVAYEQLLRQISRRLRSYLRRRLSRWPDEVEDLLQETLLAIHNQRHTYESNDGTRPLTAWLYAIARYKMIDFLRRNQRQAPSIPIDDLDDFLVADTASNNLDAHTARRDLWILLDTLPDRYRLPILCMKVEGLSVKETAARTGLSESAVKVGVHRGLKALAAQLRDSPCKPKN